MFRAFAITAIVATLIFGAPFAQGESPVDETRMTLRQEMLKLINRDRAAHGLGPVQLDIHTSIVADAYCRQQIRYGTTGHFTIDGQAPYMRYSFAGGNDGVSENAAAWSASYTFSASALLEMLRRSEEAMMAEVAPHDGHRRTILDPHATHVGIGLAWERGEFRIAQEFIRRYVDWNRPLPRTATVGEHVVTSGQPQTGYKVEAISVHFEPLPDPLTPTQANAIANYSLPERRRDYLPRLRTFYHRGADGSVLEVREEYKDGRRGDFKVDDEGAFTFVMPLADGPGIYTTVVWVSRDNEKTPPIAASNISVRVERRAAGGLTFAGTR